MRELVLIRVVEMLEFLCGKVEQDEMDALRKLSDADLLDKLEELKVGVTRFTDQL